MTFEPGQYWIARFLFYRGLFLVYFLAFLVAYRQYIPLCGEDGIFPFTTYVRKYDFWKRPSLLHVFPSDATIHYICVAGLFFSLLGFLGVEWLGSLAVGGVLLVLWLLYLSLVKVGGLFYGYGWESFLLETGILSVFLGGAHTNVPVVLLYLMAWLLFRVMFGAGMIKIRGDQCWRDLTCMDYHYETQPIPNPLSWWAHHLPSWFHKLEVLGNHFVELIVPFCYFLPQPFAGVAGLITVGFQGWLMLTGNFSWLNFLTGVVAVFLIPDSFFAVLPGASFMHGLEALHPIHQYLTYAYALVVLVLSYWPAKNLLSKRQLMNAGFDPFSLVNTYGAFGSITRHRYELVIQGRKQGGEWKTYQFKGKPTDPQRRPPQWAPYHLRIDWQLWFAAMRRRPRRWLLGLMEKLFENDPSFMTLLHHNPFADSDGPDQIRIQRYRYQYTDYQTWKEEGKWWEREYIGETFPPTTPEECRIR